MKSDKQREGKDEQPLLQGNIRKSTAAKKSQKSLGGQRRKKSEQGDCNSDKSSKPGITSKMHSEINRGDPDMDRLSKIKLQLFPIDERIRIQLEKDGHNPFLELTLSARKKISSVLTHLSKKWGSSSSAIGELMLFPFDVVVESLTSYKSWSSSNIGTTAGDVHSSVGSPEIFRLRYGWISTHPSSSRPPLVCSALENVGGALEAASGAANQAETKKNELVPCIMNDLTNETVRQRVLPTPLNLVAHIDQAREDIESLKPSQTYEIENCTVAERNLSAEPVGNEEPAIDRDLSQASVLWSDLSNISIGGLLSEASLQGRFNTAGLISGNSRSMFQPTASQGDSIDAFINQLNFSHASTNIDMPSSILDAEDTCHSFALSKDSKLSSAKDFLSLGRSAFSGLSSQDTAPRPSRFPNFEANVQNGANGCNAVQKPIADPVHCSAGVYNNENSLGLSSIRWNDSLGPFDLPMLPRQITKDDSVGIGGFVR